MVRGRHIGFVLSVCLSVICLSVHLSVHNSPLERFQKNRQRKFNQSPQTYIGFGRHDLCHSYLINSGGPNWGETSCEALASHSHILSPTGFKETRKGDYKIASVCPSVHPCVCACIWVLRKPHLCNRCTSSHQHKFN